MTLKARVEGDVSAVFLNTNDFAESVTYTPDGGSASSITALVFREPMMWTETATGSVELYRATIQVALSDVSSPGRGDAIAVTGPDGSAETWKVDDWHYQDNMWVLNCRRTEARELAGEGYRGRED